MENMDELFDRSEEKAPAWDDYFFDSHDMSIEGTDQGLERLLIILDEIAVRIREQGFVSKTQVDELVATAILASRFSDAMEAPNWTAVWPARHGHC